VYNFAVNEYMTLFQAKDCPYGLPRYFGYRGFKNIKQSLEWTPEGNEIENPLFREAWGKKVTSMKQMYYEVPVENNPFVKISPSEKTFMLYLQEKHRLEIRCWTQFRNVPYCDHFNPEEQYVLVSLPKQPINPSLPYPKDVPSRRCIFRISLNLIFHKKIPMF
jgi:hypothetical protein